ncbi:hypothetical protein RFI_11054 [Reticulomyxa filosa]|uniref:Uncharacterized protein n=1 Tax=Reticulomyxa filosa TaxID=46433 RepID=X6NJI3_RETFI|nr:hypothetical protein RFI_11054 [Reticulomyxa filosa]|eukprot:ETO26083.1 hypothetical protein RFI_11054 [Reticulomyxa filosa]
MCYWNSLEFYGFFGKNLSHSNDCGQRKIVRTAVAHKLVFFFEITLNPTSYQDFNDFFLQKTKVLNKRIAKTIAKKRQKGFCGKRSSERNFSCNLNTFKQKLNFVFELNIIVENVLVIYLILPTIVKTFHIRYCIKKNKSIFRLSSYFNETSELEKQILQKNWPFVLKFLLLEQMFEKFGVLLLNNYVVDWRDNEHSSVKKCLTLRYYSNARSILPKMSGKKVLLNLQLRLILQIKLK